MSEDDLFEDIEKHLAEARAQQNPGNSEERLKEVTPDPDQLRQSSREFAQQEEEIMQLIGDYPNEKRELGNGNRTYLYQTSLTDNRSHVGDSDSLRPLLSVGGLEVDGVRVAAGGAYCNIFHRDSAVTDTWPQTPLVDKVLTDHDIGSEYILSIGGVHMDNRTKIPLAGLNAASAHYRPSQAFFMFNKETGEAIKVLRLPSELKGDVSAEQDPTTGVKYVPTAVTLGDLNIIKQVLTSAKSRVQSAVGQAPK